MQVGNSQKSSISATVATCDNFSSTDYSPGAQIGTAFVYGKLCASKLADICPVLSAARPLFSSTPTDLFLGNSNSRLFVPVTIYPGPITPGLLQLPSLCGNSSTVVTFNAFIAMSP